MNFLGDSDQKLSVSNHAVKRWIQRVNPNSDFESAREEVVNCILTGARQDISPCFHKITHGNIIFVLKQLSPLHRLVLTSFLDEEDEDQI